MIGKLLFPARLGSYRLYKERVLALSIDGNTLYAASVVLGVRKTIIEKLYQYEIDDIKDGEQVQAAMRTCLKQFASIDYVRLVLPSSIVIFKELQLPFVDAEKIAFVLPYEIEPLIPFAVEEASISFVVNEAGSTASKIIVAASRISDIQQYVSLYGDAIQPDVLTTDVITLDALFRQIPSYKSQKGLHCFILLYERVTRIILLDEKGIKITKNMYRGVGSLAEDFSKKMSISYKDALQKIMHGFKTEALDAELEKAWIAYISEIQTGMNALLLHHEEGAHVTQTWCAGSYAHIPGLISFFGTYLNIDCGLFEAEKIMENKQIVYKGSSLASWTPFTHVLGAALPLPSQEHFSLGSHIVEQKKEALLFRLWGTALGIMCSVLLAVGGHSFYYLGQLQDAHNRLERKEIELLRPLLQVSNQKAPRVTTLKRAQTMAEAALKTKEDTWQELQKSGITPLEVWYELTKLFDKNRFDVKIDTITISRSDGPLKADVAGIFRSKTGSDHFTHFADFERRFSEAKVLALDGMNESLTDDGSVQFNTLFKIRDV